MNKNWPVKKLGEVIIHSVNSPKIKKNDYKNMGKFPIIDQSQSFIAGYTDNENYLYNGVLPVIIFGDHTQVIKYIDKPFARGADGTKVITPNTRQADPKFLFYIMSNLKLESHGYSRHFQYLVEKELIIPTLSIQKKIVERLDAIRKAQELCDQQIQKTEELFESIIRKEVVDKSSKWQNKKIRELAIMVGSGSTPRGGSAVYKSSGIYFIRSQNVLMLDLDFSDIVYIDEKENERMKRTKVSPGDILLNITGASIGRVAIFPDQYKTANVNQHVCIIRLNKEILPGFVSIYLSSKLGQEQIWKMQAGGTRQGLNFEQVKDLKIATPSLEEQQEIVEKLKSVQNYKKLLQKEKALLKELFDSVLDKSIKGEMDH